MKFDIWFTLLCISIILIISLGIYILRMKNKKQIHYAFLSLIISLFIWSFSLFLAALNNFSNMLYVYLYFFGVCFVPVSFTFLGLIFAYTKIDFNWKYKLLFIFPIIDLIIILTNPYHHLFFEKYNSINTLMEYGMFFLIHTYVSYIYILVGLVYLLYYSIKNSGFFSRQSILIILGTIIPLVLNMLENLNILELSTYTTPVAFSFTIVCFLIAIFKFDFLNVVPIALQNVVDHISDSFVVINEDLEVIDFNKTFNNKFRGIFSLKRKDNFIEAVKSNEMFHTYLDNIENGINYTLSEKRSAISEIQTNFDSYNMYFIMEISPILSKDKPLGTIILFRDITEQKKNLEKIQQTQRQLFENEKLVSLGQMIGGVAHNLRSPIMGIALGHENLKILLKELKDSICNDLVTKEDYLDIAKDMESIITEISPYCGYMNDVVSTVKDQAVKLNSSSEGSFSVEELIKRINILMKHELKLASCNLNINIEIDSSIEIKGDITNLVQIFNNIIVNAIHSYNGRKGIIDFNVHNKDKNILFSIKDYGSGIPQEVVERLGKEMTTTKGSKGTGLGVYMSITTVKGKFGGNMWYESKVNQGTTCFISIPYINKSIREVS